MSGKMQRSVFSVLFKLRLGTQVNSECGLHTTERWYKHYHSASAGPPAAMAYRATEQGVLEAFIPEACNAILRAASAMAVDEKTASIRTNERSI